MSCPDPNKKKTAVAGGGLPDDPLVEILSRVSIKDLHRSKCVARAWRDLVDGPHHRTRLPQTLQGFFFMDEDNYSRGGRFGFVSLLSRSVVDTSFSFLMRRRRQQEIKVLTLADSCNGLFLFDHGLKSSEPSDRFGYVVCNPATKRWVTVPRCDVYHTSRGPRYSYLLFDPVASSHFHLVQFWSECRRLVAESSEEESEDEHSSSEDESEDEHTSSSEEDSSMSEMDEEYPGCRQMGRSDESEEEEWSFSGEEELSRISVHSYSSETGMWTHIPSDLDEQGLEGWRHQGLIPSRGPRRAFLNGMLHIMISDRDEIAAVDARGTTQKIIPLPATADGKLWPAPGYIAPSQGRLHYINQESSADRLSVWVLEDYDKQEWVLKHSVSFSMLFGRTRNDDFHVAAMHPDGNVVFIVQSWNLKLISYDMDHQLVCATSTLKNEFWVEHLVPYVPHFLESSALTNKH